jgi:hypothetical protein
MPAGRANIAVPAFRIESLYSIRGRFQYIELRENSQTEGTRSPARSSP